MLLKRLTLENFRQFNGEQSMEFSTDKRNNVTVVLAENGTGKNPLIRSLLAPHYSFKVEAVVLFVVAYNFQLGPSSRGHHHRKYCSMYLTCLYLHSKLCRNITFVLMEKSII